MSHKRQVRKAKIVKHTKEISHGPTIAQKYIRNLPQVPHQRLTSSGLENEVPGSREEILEFQDVTDYGRYNNCTIKFQSIFCNRQVRVSLHVQFFAERLPASAIYVHDLSLQKEIGCFNHSVVILVADKLKKHW